MKRRAKRYQFVLKIIFCMVLVAVTIDPHVPMFQRDDPGQTKHADITLNAILPYATELAAHERVVYSYADLKGALSTDNGITTVYFGSNITMQATGVRIHPSKTDIIISGMNPLDPEQTQPYTLTDYPTATFVDTIYIDAAGPETVLIKDLIVTGKNYYGFFSVADLPSLSGLVVTYERVDYNGPQIAHHRAGLVRFIDCSVRIQSGNGGSVIQEVSEAKYLIFEGENSIYTESSIEGVFWFPSGGSFKMADDSSLTLTSTNTSATYGIFTAHSSAFDIDIEIGQRATFDITISGVLATIAYGTITSFTVQQGGAFHLTTTQNATQALLTISGDLTVNQDAKFIINGYGSTSYSAINQLAGTLTIEKNAVFRIVALNSYARLISLQGRPFICNNPASVLLFNANRDIQGTVSPSRIYIDAQQINYWAALSSGGLEALPDYSWRKADGSNFWIDGTMAIAASGNFTSLSSNFETGDSPGQAPNANTFSMVKARVLAFGRLEVAIHTPTEHSTSITGATAPDATVRVSFHQHGNDYVYPDVTANSEGIFRVDTGLPLAAFTVVTAKSSYQYLYATATATVEKTRILGFSVPARMDFATTELSLSGGYAARLDPDWHIVISDTRGVGSEWSLSVRLAQPLTPSDATKPVLTHALVFVNHSTMPLTSEGLLLYHHVSASDNEVSTIRWGADSGILIQIPLGSVYAGVTYTGVIEWTLIDAP